MRRLAAGAVILGLATASYAAEPLKVYEPTAEMKQLAGLAGKWRGVSTRKMNVNTSIRVIAGGSTIIEQIQAENVPEMISIYCPMGQRTLLTHYCASYTQPRMATVENNKDTNKLQFKFLDSTGMLSANQLPMHDVVIEFGDKDHFRQTWYSAGGGAPFQVLDYMRVSGPLPRRWRSRRSLGKPK